MSGLRLMDDRGTRGPRRRSDRMTQFRLHPVERAFELAKTGIYRSRSEIARAMEKDGYTMADVNQLEGTSLTRQLNGLCREAMARLPKTAA